MQTTIKDTSKSRLHLYLVLFVIVVLAGFATLFQLWEQDINWQIKAGNEILKSFTLQKTEHWSYTVNGTPWFNFQWLATIVIATVYQFFKIEGLIFFRALLLVSLLGLLLATIKKYTRDHFLKVSILFLPFFYSAIVPRIQMRPEFFVIVMNALLILIWQLDKSHRFKIGLSSLIILISTNIHPGVVPFLLLNVAAFLFQLSLTTKQKAGYFFLVTLCFFITPYASGLPSFLLRHLNYEANTFMPNPEYFPLSLEDFRLEDNSLFVWSWLILTAVFFIGWFQKKSRDIFTLIVFILLTLLCFKAPRAIPFALLFAFPTIISGLTNFSQKPFIQKHHYAVLIFCIFWEVLQIKTTPSPLGLTVYNEELPQTTLQFIKTHHPQGNILHAPFYGDFLLKELPDYPVFFDSREIPYDSLQKDIRAMFERPDRMMVVLQKYKVQTLLLPMNFIFSPPLLQGISRRESFFKPAEWAVVAFDQSSMLLLKRIPEHQKLIAQFEYKYALPDKSFNPNSDDVKKELMRCRQENPTLPFCQQ